MPTAAPFGPPFRADHVGSLLRPPALAAVRRRFAAGEIAAPALEAAEDAAIREAVALQEGLGLHGITDGEFRRAYWHLDFLEGFDGIEVSGEGFGHAFSTGVTAPTARTVRRITRHDGRMRKPFAFLKAATALTAKLSIPGPGMAHLRGGRRSVSAVAYPDLAAFWDDLAAAYGAEIRALGEAGCTYLQIDDVSFAYLCDEKFRAGVREGGEDPDALLRTYAEVTSRVAASRPPGMTITTHMCRGNNQSAWMAEGGYEAVAEAMFATLDVDGYFMEYDSERAGGFEPLRYLPADKVVVVGLITTKTPALESKETVRRRLDEVSRHVPLERVCLSPQCGFASTHHGNKVSQDDQRRKLALVVEIASEVWGDA